MAESVSSQDAAAGGALQRAVRAEQDARRIIAEAEVEAAATVERARAAARARLNGVPDRIARLRERGEHAVRAALTGIQAEEATATSKLRETVLAPELLERSVAQLVGRLTGAGDDKP